MYTGFEMEKVKRDHLKDLGADGRTILTAETCIVEYTYAPKMFFKPHHGP
jgi:hypothetical protein